MNQIQEDAAKWQKFRGIVQERFWCDLLYGRYVNMEFSELQRIAQEFDLILEEHARYVPIFLRIFMARGRPQHRRTPEETIQARNALIQELLLGDGDHALTITIHPRLFAAVRQLPPGESIGDVERQCGVFTEACKKQLRLNMVCIPQGPFTVLELASSSNSLREFMDSIQEPTHRVSGEEVVRQVKEYLRGNLHRRVSREELAAVVHLNPDHMARLFQRHTAKSLTEYMAEEKMHHACEKLATTDEPIGSIAASLGYENLSYFSRRFERYVGALPSTYRKQHKY